MAFYSYACESCGHKATVSKPMSQATAIEYCGCSPFQPMQRVWDAPPAALVHAGTPKFHQRSSK